ncbi:cellulose biosynthesis cyclic di-GMP-binding regulatory protein BcsB [Moorena bouillonii]|uniref:cellulose biosynthesis cyclic di-GMP-binding regulatory protein BcsB n=1 Tax=Moorena bouillonii TaxID=207920 RepID=UPI000A537C86|nr:cellulose biosynthesis cyclic di-GMP-binding regulatory protein BcsB [Moorena bouillonii]
MTPFFRKAFAHLPKKTPRSHQSDGHSSANQASTSRRFDTKADHPRPSFPRYSLVLLLFLSCSISIGLTTRLVYAQTDGSSTDTNKTLRESTIEELKEKSQPTFALPSPPTKAPEIDAPAAGQYILEFNRSPVVGSRLSLRGIYDEARLGFTRPRDWQLKSVKASIRFRHSPALYATRSNLTVLINGVSVGSIPLNRQEGEIGNVLFNIPIDQLRNYNQITIAALQNNSPTCTQDPYDPSLWTEILPDSKIVFDFEPQPVSLDFNRYPYPIFDDLSLEPNQITYLLPKKIDDNWLTSTARFQASLGRLADYRRLKTSLVKSVKEASGTGINRFSGNRLVIIGTPEQQPELKSLKLPLPVGNNKILDAKDKALPPDVGVLMLTTTPGNEAAVLVATGNGPEGVAKAVQFLVQSQDRQIATSQVILVEKLEEVPTPAPRDWPDYLPLEPTFKLSDLKTPYNQPIEDITVRGSDSPPITIDFRALPDDQFEGNNYMNLIYSYSPQINPKTSVVEVKLDGIALIGKKLKSIDGGTRESLRVALPTDKINPYSKIEVDFRLDARERRSCSKVTDQQLWGTLHSDTNFELQRTSVAKVPDLGLLKTGFPFAAPQDLSNTVIVLPKDPSTSVLMTLLKFTNRLGRLSKAESIQLSVYTKDSLPTEERSDHHLVGIGTQNKFPFPEIFSSGDLKLKDFLTRQRSDSQIQTWSDHDGVIKEIISPWNKERVLLALIAQTDKGLDKVQDFLSQDPLFSQIKGDTVLISANSENPDSYDQNSYNMDFFQQERKRQMEKPELTQQIFNFIIRSWLMLAPAIIAATLISYGVIQFYLQKMARDRN